MKRQMNFEFENNKYVIKENDEIIFSIDGSELKFMSLEFYNGIYKDKSAAIELTYAIGEDPLKKGGYIFDWLTQIIQSIQLELNDPEPYSIENVGEITVLPKKVPLYELSACAGEGFYSSGPSAINSDIDSPYCNADYAVNISGESMEPTVQNKSTVFVQRTQDISDGDIGVFVVNNQVMCKRYREEGERKWLEPDNKAPEYMPIYLNEDTQCVIQGKVLIE